VDAVVRENRHRALWTKVAIQERLADAPSGAERLPIRDLPPALALALGDEDALGRVVRPVHEPFGHAAGARAELLRRAQIDVSVPALSVDFCGGESKHGPRGRVP